jgi:hypothetical protein
MYKYDILEELFYWHILWSIFNKCVDTLDNFPFDRSVEIWSQCVYDISIQLCQNTRFYVPEYRNVLGKDILCTSDCIETIVSDVL